MGIWPKPACIMIQEEWCQYKTKNSHCNKPNLLMSFDPSFPYCSSLHSAIYWCRYMFLSKFIIIKVHSLSVHLGPVMHEEGTNPTIIELGTFPLKIESISVLCTFWEFLSCSCSVQVYCLSAPPSEHEWPVGKQSHVQQSCLCQQFPLCSLL